MSLDNIDIKVFFEFPGILITIGVIFLLISIIIMIVVYISEKKHQNINATALSQNYEYTPENEVNFPNPTYNQNEKNNDIKQESVEAFEPQVDAFATEFSNNEETKAEEYSNNEVSENVIKDKEITIKPEEPFEIKINLPELEEKDEIKMELPKVKDFIMNVETEKQQESEIKEENNDEEEIELL